MKRNDAWIVVIACLVIIALFCIESFRMNPTYAQTSSPDKHYPVFRGEHTTRGVIPGPVIIPESMVLKNKPASDFTFDDAIKRIDEIQRELKILEANQKEQIKLLRWICEGINKGECR
jgi:hypothetical protein